MHRRVLLTSLLVVAMATIACGGPSTVATVNGVTIANARLERQLEGVLDDPQFAAASEDDRLQVERTAIVLLIQEILIRQEATRLGIQIDPPAVDEGVGQIRSQFSTDEEFRQSLASRAISEASFPDQVRARLMLDQIEQRVAGGTQATEDEARVAYGRGDRYAKLRVRHIQFSIRPGSDEQMARGRAEDALRRLRAGADFATLAKQLSDEPGASTTGGLLPGYIDRTTQIDEQFKQAAFALQVKRISEVAQTASAFHILRVEERVTQPFESVRAELLQMLTQRKRLEVFRAHVAELIRRARISVNPKYGKFDLSQLQQQLVGPTPTDQPLPSQ
jgi:parvulin-like peptidyl-prolyl isomerase